MLSVVILSGGQSSRIGQDKALLPFLGKTLIEQVLQRLSPIADDLQIISNHPAEYGFLGVPVVSDIVPGRGALGGVYTALSGANHPLVAIVACDMPFASSRLLEAEIDLLQQTGADAVVPRSDQGNEPLHSIYCRQLCLPAARRALEAGKWRVDSWFPEVNVTYMPEEMVLIHDPHRLAFWNLNTLEDFQREEELAHKQNMRP